MTSMDTALPDVGRTWLADALDDIDCWASVMPADADGNAIDWDWVRALDLAHGIGAAHDADTLCGAAGDLYALLRHDYAVRDRLEPIIAHCSTAFMGDFDRIIPSYRLPRALAYANRRLSDEIAALVQRGVAEGRWRVTYERRQRVTVPVLHALGDTDPAMLAGLQDRTADIVNGRAARRRQHRTQQHAARQDMARANLSGATAPGGTITLFGGEADSAPAPGAAGRDGHGSRGAGAGTGRADWRDAYLPGRDVGTVMGIDIETTGIDPARVYIIDVGFEFMDMAVREEPADGGAAVTPGAPGAPDDAGGSPSYRYEQAEYRAQGAYGQARLSFGVPERNARLGNPMIASLTGIDVRERAASAGYRLFDEWPAAQRGLLARLEAQPYVAHNATFEHGFFMLNVAGYAERYRAGGITILDTMPMSRRWDAGSAPDERHPYGDNTLESYAKRQGALAASQSERHLGLEDAHIMLVAMKRHLASLRAEGRGPWGVDGRAGVGGKRCGR